MRHAITDCITPLGASSPITMPWESGLGPSAKNEDMRSLAVILVQYNRQKYPQALRRLVQKTQSLENTRTTLVVVDNLWPGDWYHEVSSDLFHLAGDNSSWEFSAFDRGRRFLAENNREFDLYAFVTDAFTAYGDGFLDLIDNHTLDYTLGLRACTGWVDSIFESFQAFDYRYVQYLRTSFLLMPAPVLKQLGTLTTPIEVSRLFSGDPAAPFRQDAPLSRNLQDFLITWLTGAPSSIELERQWHSRFDLDESTLPLFEAKTLAILREHLLSARLLGQGAPCFDFRLLNKLSERQVTLDQISAENRQRWQWLRWRDTSVDIEPQFFVERSELPEAITHGDSAHVSLRGWVVTDPQISEIHLEIGTERRYSLSCDLPRNDGLPGFDSSLDLQFLPPGNYDIDWVIPTLKPVRRRLGGLRVVPCHRFVLDRLFLPQSANGAEVPIALQGQFITTYPLRRARPLWNGKTLPIQVSTLEKPRLDNGLYVYQIKTHDTFFMESPQEQHLLSLVFETANGTSFTWNRNALITPDDSPPYQLTERHIGPYDKASGLTPVRLLGWVFAASPKAKILLEHEGRTILEEPLCCVDSSTGAGTASVLGRFDISRQLAGIPSGVWGFELQLQTEPHQPAQPLVAWQEAVGFLEPIIHLDQLTVETAHGGPHRQLLRLIGWVDNDFLVDYLTLEIDAKKVGVLGLNQLRPDAAYETEQSLIRRQGFHFEQVMDLEPGAHAIRLKAGQADGALGTWQGTVQIAEPIRDQLHLESLDIEQMMSKTPSHFWSALQLTGRAETPLRDVVARLYVDGIKRDEQPIVGEGTFCLRHVPEKTSHSLARVVFESHRQILFDSEIVTVHLHPLRLPETLHPFLRRLFDYFEIHDPLLTEDMELTCRRLMERNVEDLPAFLDRLGRLDQVLIRAAGKNRVDNMVELSAEPSPELPDRPLRILFACWEVPSLRHGGGVCMSNLLMGLSKKHQVTVLHPFSLEESGWIEDIRPYVTKIISLPREYHPATYRHDRGIPAHYFANYVPALRRALEAELASGDYDIVNYEYTTMYSHISASPIPSTLVVHELGYRAKLTSYFKDNRDAQTSMDQLQDLLETLHFYTDSLPRACRNLIALTQEDGEALARLQGPETRIFVNTIGVDEERFEPPAAVSPDPEAPTLVFLGNYRHPPNVHAAKFFAEEVMPKVTQRHPKARFLIIGSHLPPELEEAAQSPCIEVTGFVDDFRPFLWQATAFVAPIFVGAGMRVKILEAMACGCPIISTELGMNGLGSDAGVHYLHAETAEEFAVAACRLIEEPTFGSGLGAEARRLVEERHSWRLKATDREAIWARLLREQRQLDSAEEPKTRLASADEAPRTPAKGKGARGTRPPKASLARKQA